MPDLTLTTPLDSLLAAADFGAVKTLLTLNLVDNTSDAGKPVSTAQATAIALKSPLAGSSSIVTTGALTSGSTGAGFTIALSTSTVTGTLPDSAFPTVLPAVSGANLTNLPTFNPASTTSLIPVSNLGASLGASGIYFREAYIFSAKILGADFGNPRTINVSPASGVNFDKDMALQWYSGANFGGAIDITLIRSASGVMAMRSGTLNQTLSLGAASGTGGGVLVLHQSATPPTPTAEDVQISFDGVNCVIDKPVTATAFTGDGGALTGIIQTLVNSLSGVTGESGVFEVYSNGESGKVNQLTFTDGVLTGSRVNT